ncbi:hypothetical protein SEA_HAIL_75 [Mycobacterium phage Hail]|nr:hypothetical protein Giles_75 [Mycobacterium phage Giles]ABW88470.2 hypothetical protein Giles_75 [Mycobacterium phage Giles]QUE25476.1 hypothetical protein SEA_LUNA22_75 [Mycobacterium phage Luna22]QXO13831.1 hypothetical protein SEA_HAIL_75 [Mycobacterium phage Hail]QZD99129.1 hypothetical protein SEA_FORGE_75 [Mycobacterium phage Forge]
MGDERPCKHGTRGGRYCPACDHDEDGRDLTADHEPPPTMTLCAHHIPPGDCTTCGPKHDIRHTVQHDIAGYAHVDGLRGGTDLHSVTCTCGHLSTGETRHDAYRSHNTHALHPEA